jgi:hypothetical protein
MTGVPASPYGVLPKSNEPTRNITEKAISAPGAGANGAAPQGHFQGGVI